MKIKRYVLIFLALMALFISFRHGFRSLLNTEWSIYAPFYAKQYHSLALIIAIIIIALSLKLFKKSHFKFDLTPCFIMVLSMCLLFSGAIVENHKIKKPVILQAEYDGSVYILYLTLYEDGTFRINKPPCCAGVIGVCYKGNYSLNSDTIFLDRNVEMGGFCLSKEWIIEENRIWFYTYFPSENIIFEDSLHFKITERK